MEFTAISKSVRISPRKVGLVADVIRGKRSIDEALASLYLTRKRAAGQIEKTLKSVIANAINRGAKREDLVIKSVIVNPGSFLKRYRPSTRGRQHPYKKRSSHIKITLSDEKSQVLSLPSKTRLPKDGKSQVKKEKEQEVKKPRGKSLVKGARHGSEN